jgi:hypothetical protein
MLKASYITVHISILAITAGKMRFQAEVKIAVISARYLADVMRFKTANAPSTLRVGAGRKA